MDAAVRLGTARTFLVRTDLGAAGHIVQRSDLTSRRIIVEQATLIVVEEGRKRIRWRGGDCVARPRDAIAIQAGETVDISNTPGPNGAYRALWICWSQVPEAQGSSSKARVALQRGLTDEFLASYHRAFDGLSGANGLPSSIASSRLNEVLLWLAERKFQFSPPPPASFGARVRRLVASDPNASMGSVARETATSIPTLRRRLAAEGLHFRDLVQDVRMAHALALLQNTDRSVLEIALATGYASPSRFTARFRARFGYLPTDVRGQHRGRST